MSAPAVRTTASDADRLADFARASGDMLWECDAAWRYTWVAAPIEALGGGDEGGSLVGQALADGALLDSHGEPIGQERLYHRLARPEPFSDALTEVRTPRSRVMVLRAAVPLFDADGRHAGWRGTARDVSVRVALARSERERDEQLRKMTTLLPGALYQYHEPAMQQVQFPTDPADASRLFGLHTQLQHGPLRLHPAELPELGAAYLHARATQSPWHLQFRVLQADDQERWLENRAMPERSADGTWLWHGFVSDISERRRVELALRASEERWLLAAEATATGLAQIDCREQTLLLDRMACINHGMAWPHPTLHVEDWLLRIHEDDRAAARDALARAQHDGERMEARYRFRLPDGGLRWLEVFARAQMGPDGQPLTIVGTCRDVTAQQQAVQLQRAKDEAERANRAKSELLSRVSHELRTPLNGILGFAQLMGLDREQPLGTAQRRRLEGVEQAGRHLLALVNDVLDLTRLERGEFGLQAGPVDVVRALDAALGLVKPLLTVHPVQLPAELPTGPVWAQADARGLQQVLVNLLSNAIKYNRPNGHVHFELRELPLQVVLTIEDEGAGLTEDEQRQLFQPFNRLGAERHRIEGSGLGLVIASELVRSMNGALSVTSRAGVGSRFSVALALARAPGDALPQAQALPPPWRVVYIEDEPLNALLMQEVFRAQSGWQLVVARNGSEGLERVRAMLPDMVLVDMNLPDMTGLQIIAALRADARTAGLRCVALSADAMSEQIAAARRAGFDDYWTKPIDVARMLQTVEQAIRSRP